MNVIKRLSVVFALLFLGASSLSAGQLVTPEHIKAVPPLTFTDANGRTLDLSAFRGKVVLLDLWATWCAPCRAEFPALDRLQGKMTGRDLVVVPVSLDRRGMAVVEPFYRELNIVHLEKYVGGQELTRILGLRGVPTTLVIDREGREVGRVEGTAPWDDPEMIRGLEVLLK